MKCKHTRIWPRNLKDEWTDRCHVVACMWQLHALYRLPTNLSHKPLSLSQAYTSGIGYIHTYCLNKKCLLLPFTSEMDQGLQRLQRTELSSSSTWMATVGASRTPIADREVLQVANINSDFYALSTVHLGMILVNN